MYDIIRWISLVMLWVCIGLNVGCIIRSFRNCKKMDRNLAEIEALREKWIERVNMLEEVSDEGSD